MTWLVVILLTLGAAGQRLLGMYAIGSLLERRPVVRDLADLLPAAVVTALVAQLTLSTAGELTVDARAAGLAVAGVLVWRRAPFVVIVVAAAATTALLRAVG
ncbi:MAG: AzlD domain-containing protein [Acidimicrobiales bacterium]